MMTRIICYHVVHNKIKIVTFKVSVITFGMEVVSPKVLLDLSHGFLFKITRHVNGKICCGVNCVEQPVRKI